MAESRPGFSAVALVGKPDEPRVAACVAAVAYLLESRGIDFVVDGICARWLPESTGREASAETLYRRRDLIIAIGGDGTMLHAAHNAAVHDVPVVGINLGKLGFLTDLNPHQIVQGLGEILSGRYLTDQRPLLTATLVRNDEEVLGALAINDVVIQKWATAGLIRFDTLIDGTFVHTQRSDGMIICTSTGSTAYALSGAGPIIHPSVAAMALVPICPHTLTNRPLIISDNSTIDVVMRGVKPDEAHLTCDGIDTAPLMDGDRVHICKHARSARLLHRLDHDHYLTLRTKLNWNNDLC